MMSSLSEEWWLLVLLWVVVTAWGRVLLTRAEVSSSPISSSRDLGGYDAAGQGVNLLLRALPWR
jgi:hypothetical protein